MVVLARGKQVMLGVGATELRVGERPRARMYLPLAYNRT